MSDDSPHLNSTLVDQTLALGGLIQSATLVESVAKNGMLDQAYFETCIYSLFQQNPESTEEVFKDRSHLRLGLTQLVKILENDPSSRNSDAVKYAMSVIHLQKRLAHNSDMLQIIDNRLQQAKSQVDHFSLTHENVIASLASIYQDTISTFRFRVQVIGTVQYLQQPATADRVRALLFAAIRAAMLWRQVGGTRWQFLFKRKQLTQCANALL